MSPRTIWASLSPSKVRTGAPAGSGRSHRACEPDLAGAAAHLVGLRAQRVGQRRQRAPELDHIAVAVLPVVEEGEVRADGVERRGRTCRPCGDRARSPVPVALCIWSARGATQAGERQSPRRLGSDIRALQLAAPGGRQVGGRQRVARPLPAPWARARPWRCRARSRAGRAGMPRPRSLRPPRADEVDGHAGAELGLLHERRPQLGAGRASLRVAVAEGRDALHRRDRGGVERACWRSSVGNNSTASPTQNTTLMRNMTRCRLFGLLHRCRRNCAIDSRQR